LAFYSWWCSARSVTFSDPKRKPIIDKLKSIAGTFVDLQQARHEADYNLRISFTRSEAGTLVELAEKAFSDWNGIRNDDLGDVQEQIRLPCILLHSSPQD